MMILRLRVVLLATFIFALLILCVSYSIASKLVSPALHPIGEPPSDLNALNVQFDGVRGWFVPAQNTGRCVLLMHGVRADRRSMIERARLLRRAGYSSLLFDFQAHGESPGQQITFGYLESVNAHNAIMLLHDRFKCTKIAAIGQSLGGAAALLGETPIKADALVLESVYPTIDEAISDRLQIRLGHAGALLTPLLTMQIRPRLGIDPQNLRPISRIGSFHHPVFIMAGTADRHTPINEARRLYEAATGPKEFWAVQGAGHVDLQRFAPEAYREKLLDFLSKYL